MTKKVCSICGIRPATTVEHIPPRCMFPPPRPMDTITVPACRECNESTSVEDEEFRLFVSMFAGKSTPEAERLWVSKTLPTVKSNRRLLRKAKASIKPAYLKSKGGIIFDKCDIVTWDDSPSKVVDKIVRGLYFHHYGEILADRVNITINQVRSITIEKAKCLDSLNVTTVGGNQFVCRFARANEDPLYSTWFMMFQKALMLIAFTTPK
jgi:hypothetical protein